MSCACYAITAVPLGHRPSTQVGSESKLYKDGALEKLLQGQFPPRTNLMVELDDRTQGYRPNPTEAQKFHGVIVCIAATDVSDEEKSREISYFNSIVRDRGIPSMLVITKVCRQPSHAVRPLIVCILGSFPILPTAQVDAYDQDLLDGGLCEPDDEDDEEPGEPLDMRQLYRSIAIKELLDEAEKRTGFAKVDMVPIANKTKQDNNEIPMPKACQLAEMLRQVVKRAGQYRRQEAKHGRSQAASGVPPPPPASVVPAASIAPGGSFVNVTAPPSEAGFSRGRTMQEVLIMICQELGLQAPPDVSLKDALNEANDLLDVTPQGSIKAQLQALVTEIGLDVTGWP